MSYVKRGGGGFAARAEQARKNLEANVKEANEQAAKIIQEEVVARCPVKTGKLRSLFASSDAIQSSWKYRGGFVFGLVTPQLKGDGYYARFVEYGTKGYHKGELRYAGRDKKTGRIKWKKMKRAILSHPAHPFFRPGVAAGRARVRALYAAAVKESFDGV